MTAPTVSDDEFIRLWNKLGSPDLVSKQLGVGIRSIYKRRRSMEEKYGQPLESFNSQNQHDITKRHDGRAHLEVKDGMVIVFSDAHYWPGIVSTAHRALLELIDQFKPTAVICNGDAFDGGGISRFPRIGWDDKPTVKQEIETVTERLTEIEDLCKGKLVWTLGNHDARYETFLAARAPEFEGVRGFTLKEQFPRWTPAWSCWINQMETVVKHRWKGGIHATHNNTVNSGVNFVTGHLHSLKVTPFSDYRGTRYGVDTGTLADPNGPQFLDYSEDSPKNHRSGFAVLTFYKGELLMPELCQIKDEDAGEVVFRGAVIKV